MVRRAQAALRSVEHTSVRQLRVLAAIVFLFAMVIATVAPAVTAPMAFADSSTSSSSSSSSSSVDYATWAEVSKAMDKQLNSGLKTYKDGNTAGATSDFMGAYNKIYVAPTSPRSCTTPLARTSSSPNSRHSKAFRIFPTRLATTIN